MGINPADVICTDRYPVMDKSHAAFQRLCVHAQTALAQQNVYMLPDFVRPQELQQMYRYHDAHGALNIAIMVQGDEFGWHFDQTDFVVSLVLQAPEAGGEFLCRPVMRADDEARDQAVLAVLEKRCQEVAAVPMHAGSLMLFQGRHALHRVTPIHKAMSREWWPCLPMIRGPGRSRRPHS